eukprot:SAG31_NODE_3387_length_4330_cov_3.992437_3_plen_106_part_00
MQVKHTESAYLRVRKPQPTRLKMYASEARSLCHCCRSSTPEFNVTSGAAGTGGASVGRAVPQAAASKFRWHTIFGWLAPLNGCYSTHAVGPLSPIPRALLLAESV